jgi:bacterioferritin (cytochrome b1)
MTNEELIKLLNEDLKNEYKHLHFYLRSSVTIRGLHRNSIQAFLAGEAQTEMQHVLQFSKKVRSLGGIPVAEANPSPVLEDPREILEYAQQMEKEVVDIYARRIKQVEHLDSACGIDLRMFYETQLQESYGDSVEIKEMLREISS